MAQDEKTRKELPPALMVAKQTKDGEQKVLSTGVRANLIPVAASLLETVNAQIVDPDPPLWVNEEKGTSELNPLDPTYLAKMRETRRKRYQASFDAMILFGVELVDPVPPLNDWLPKLKFLEKSGSLDLSIYDLNDPLECEYLYKRFIAVASEDLMAISRLTGVTEEAIKVAEASF